MAKEEMTRLRRRHFEFMTIPVFDPCEGYLGRCFGNYQEFPPEEERGVWHSGQVHYDPDVPFRDYLSEEA